MLRAATAAAAAASTSASAADFESPKQPPKRSKTEKAPQTSASRQLALESSAATSGKVKPVPVPWPEEVAAVPSVCQCSKHNNPQNPIFEPACLCSTPACQTVPSAQPQPPSIKLAYLAAKRAVARPLGPA